MNDSELDFVNPALYAEKAMLSNRITGLEGGV